MKGVYILGIVSLSAMFLNKTSSQECEDDPNYLALGKTNSTCKDWENLYKRSTTVGCRGTDSIPGYTDSQLKRLRNSCRLTCHQCPAADYVSKK